MQGDVIGFVFGGVTLAAYLLLQPSPEKRMIQKRVLHVRQAAETGESPEEKKLREPLRERVFKPLLGRVGRTLSAVSPAGLKQEMNTKLVRAGNPIGTFEFIAYKALCALGMGLFFLLFILGGKPAGERMLLLVLFTAIAAVLGFFLPDVWLSRFISERGKNLEKDLPDVLDLLTVSVEAGLGFDGAMQKVGDKFKDPIAAEFKAYLKEIRLGKTRVDALRSLAERTEHPDIQVFVAAIVQADQLGVGISKVLRVQAEQMRFKRKQRAQERAMQLPVKIVFPLVFFVFPSLFVVLMGPVVIHLMNLFK